jgi:mannose-6-phosphate isomerase
MQVQRLQSQRVRRFYRGGALIGRLRGSPEEDGPFPEDWLGSVTRAHNRSGGDPHEGFSRLENGRLLRDAIAADPIGWLGERHLSRYGESTGLLVKLLDAAERLPVHAHPNRDFALAHLDSRFGKTEAWIVLATRESHGGVWVGLRDSVDHDMYRAWIERQDVDALLGALNHLEVGAGDTIYVPAGLPHAIGPGILLLELQEPTDFSILCEWRGFPIRPEDAHLGLGWKRALAAFDLGAHEPKRYLPEEARPFFWADAKSEPAGRFAILVVVDGEGRIDGQSARSGDAFAVPARAQRFETEGDLRVLRCLAPDAE